MTGIPDTHAEAWNLLPWLANGRLAPADREWVEAHVHNCEACRAELTTQRQLVTQMRADADQPVAVTEEQRSFDRLWSRIEASEGADIRATRTDARPVVRRRPSLVRWLAAAVVVQGFGLALLGFNALRTPAASDLADFHTVSTVESAQPGSPAVRIVFAPEASIASINTLLAHQGLTIVSGPGVSGNFTATLSPDAIAAGASAESVASVMAGNPNVSFAQPITR